MNAPVFHVSECNALGRAIPKLLRAMHTRKTNTTAWDEAFHVYYAAAEKHGTLRRLIAGECEPWFDNSAFEVSRTARGDKA